MPMIPRKKGVEERSARKCELHLDYTAGTLWAFKPFENALEISGDSSVTTK